MRKLVVGLVLILAVTFSFAALGFKIGVVTGTVSQGEDEYRGAENVIAKYGKEIIHVTYPDKFMQEQETTIARIVELAYDPMVKAIVICQGVPGTVSAIRRVKEFRPDMIFVVGVAHEDPELVGSVADVSFQTDDLGRGVTIIDLAYSMGAKRFIHYSFPRHMSYKLLAERRDIMERRCKELGIEFIFVSAPDPLGEQGLTGAQQFILEDVPRQIAKYGKDTAFFSTNCGMQEPLQKAILQHGGIYAEPCCPSPTHGFPGSLGIAIPPEKKGDINYILKAVNSKIVEQGGAGRFATWPIPINMVFVEAGVDLAVELVKKTVKADDMNGVKAIFDKVISQKVSGYGLKSISRYPNAGNYYLVICDSVIFGKTQF
ncbi:DUF3798 domain-containing protein [Thermotoga profunda]|uniref:DUF3798 domain-containing protein n=1 Tax=Thermotoga profunda TaxID=1508420 RepID=UPI000597C973|nr:DUF3798 domain-containing protein [Thermotoga profunda]